MYSKGRRKFLYNGSLIAFGCMFPKSLLPATFSNNSLGNKKHNFLADNLKLDYEPSYVNLQESGELRKRANQLWGRMMKCDLCPRECDANRLKGERGTCRANHRLQIASFHPHFGEEPEISGRKGSGTIFLTHCSLRCVFCINYDVSHQGKGNQYGINDFADMMLKVQEMGCHNLNLVTPSHYLAHILRALDIAVGKGLRIPLVYNCCGWEKLDVLKMLDGVVDVYLPDFKYMDPVMSSQYSAGAHNYPEITSKALLEMNCQVGLATPDSKDGLVRRGLMIRHLVMPNHIDNSIKVMQWIAANLPKNTYVNIMAQYRPMYRAHEYPKISRGLTRDEYSTVIQAAKEAGLTNIHTQS